MRGESTFTPLNVQNAQGTITAHLLNEFTKNQGALKEEGMSVVRE